MNYLNLGAVKAEQIKARDIVSIYYITDTDYCFHGAEDYHKNKAQCLKKIFMFDTMDLIKDRGIPFKTIFFSKHLEHILENNEKNLSIEEKEKIAMSFSEQALNKEGFFVEFFLNKDIKKWQTYEESYLNIINYQGRACNMNNLINEFKLK